MREQSIQLVRWLVLSGTNKLLGFILLSVLRKHFSYTVRPEDLANDKYESRSGPSCSHRQKVGFTKIRILRIFLNFKEGVLSENRNVQ